MLEYLKQKIAEKEQEKQSVIQENVNDLDSQMDEAILECAHLFEEMEELTVVGKNALRERPVIDIPIEDDLELTTVEYDYMTQRLVDVPMDVQTTEAYNREKHFEDFYNEAAKSIMKMTRENDKQYEARIHQEATKRYNAYREYIIQEGLFGNDILDWNDGRIPRNKLVDLGPIDLDKPNGRHYITKLPVYFQVNKKDNNTVQLDQIHALSVIDNLNAFYNAGTILRETLIEKEGFGKKLYNVGIWDIVTPKALLVPRVETEFTVIITFDVEGIKGENSLRFSIPKSEIRMSRQGKIQNEEEIKNKISEASENGAKNKYITSEKHKSMEGYKSKADAMKEESKKDDKVQESVTPTFNRWTFGRQVYQEAIDFGDGTAQAPAAPAPDAGAGAPPPIDGTAPAATTDQTAAPAVDGLGVGDDGTQPAAAPADNTATVTTNDVSQQIADNVANITAANASADGDLMSSTPTFDNNVDDTFNNLDSAMGADETGVDMGDTSTDVSPTPDLGLDANTDAGTTDDTAATDVPTVDSDPLADLGADATDSIGTTDDTTDPSLDDLGTDDTAGVGDVDIDNMSMDDMVTQAVEKIKTMPMNKLKSFLSDGTITESSVMFVDDVDLDVVMESVSDPTDAVKLSVRKVLGDLNDTKGSLADIVKNVKRDHKHANRAIVKAMKNTELGKSANAELENLNNALNELVLKLNATPAKEEVENIKNAIKNFTTATKRTSKFIDFNKGIVTESFSIVMNKDEMGNYVMEGAHGKVIKNTLWGWFIGHFGVRRDHATKKGGKYKYHLHAPTFILFLFGFPITSSIWNAIHAHRLSKDEIDDISVKTIMKDMSKISTTLFESSDGSVEIVKMRKFKHAVDDLSDDLKYIIKRLKPNATKLRDALTKLKGSADVVLEHVDKGSEDGGKYLQELLDNMDNTARILCDVDKVIEPYKSDAKFVEIMEIQKLTADDIDIDDEDNVDNKDGE